MARRDHDPRRTRRKILEAAYREFYHHGFQGGSLSQIVAAAGITKGALFYHFAGKNELGYAVIEELLVPAVQHWWIEPLASTNDPVPALRAILSRFRKHIEQETPDSGFVYNGCPICNFATEMSPLDEGFRARLDKLYTGWRQAIAIALRRGQKAGTVRPDTKPSEEAAFLVAGMAGIPATGKVAQQLALYRSALRVMDRYVETLAAQEPNPKTV